MAIDAWTMLLESPGRSTPSPARYSRIVQLRPMFRHSPMNRAGTTVAIDAGSAASTRRCARAAARRVPRRGAVRRAHRAAATRPTRRSTRSTRSASSCRATTTTCAPRSPSCRELGVPVLPRGAGSSQCGQTVGDALVDRPQQVTLDRIVGVRPRRDAPSTVEPGVVLDRSTRCCKPHGLWFPVDVSTSAQATIGGMAGNNSCGSRSIAYGNMVHNVAAIDALLADGSEARFGDAGGDGGRAGRACASSSTGFGDRRARARRDRARRADACCAASAATTSTSSTRRASGRTPPTAASTSRTCWSAAKARSRGRARLTLTLAPLPRAQGARRGQLPDASTARWSARSTS